MSVGFLDPTMVPPPVVASSPVGLRVPFGRIVSDAGMIDVVSSGAHPEIRLHDGRDHVLVRVPGSSVHCVSVADSAPEARERARHVMTALAYGFHEWAAREVVSRFHRDLKRSRSQAARAADVPDSEDGRVAAFVSGAGKVGADDMAAALGMERRTVVRALVRLHDRGIVRLSRSRDGLSALAVDRSGISRQGLDADVFRAR